VAGEPVLLAVLIGNLVDNALRYNRPHGHITVHTGTAEGVALLRVANTGEPIPPDRAAALLEPFVRGPAEGPARPGGSGLGLSIAQGIALAHGGEIVPRSRPEGGLDITVRLPAADAGTDPDTATRPATSTGSRPQEALPQNRATGPA
jgi:signal transduction histidine kinase